MNTYTNQPKKQESPFQKVFEDPFTYLELEHKVYQRERELILRDINFKPDMSVLDVGSGTGICTREIAKKVAPHGKAIGVDSSERMVKQARERIKKDEITALIEFHVGDVYDLKFEDDEFDASFAGALFMYLREPERALEELKRVTKKGGKIILTEDEDLNSWIIYPVDVDLWREFLVATRKVLSKMEEEDQDFRFDQYFTRKYFSLFTKAGLKNIQFKVYPYVWRGIPNKDLIAWLKTNLIKGWELIHDTNYLSDVDKEILKNLFLNENSELFNSDDFLWQRCEYMVMGEV